MPPYTHLTITYRCEMDFKALYSDGYFYIILYTDLNISYIQWYIKCIEKNFPTVFALPPGSLNNVFTQHHRHYQWSEFSPWYILYSYKKKFNLLWRLWLSFKLTHLFRLLQWVHRNKVSYNTYHTCFIEFFYLVTSKVYIFTNK